MRQIAARKRGCGETVGLFRARDGYLVGVRRNRRHGHGWGWVTVRYLADGERRDAARRAAWVEFDKLTGASSPAN